MIDPVYKAADENKVFIHITGRAGNPRKLLFNRLHIFQYVLPIIHRLPYILCDFLNIVTGFSVYR